MYGISPIAIPLMFKSTTFPSVEECLNSLSWAQQEALAAHELAQVRMADRFKRTASTAIFMYHPWTTVRRS